MYSIVSGQFFQTIPVQKTKDKYMRNKTESQSMHLYHKEEILIYAI